MGAREYQEDRATVLADLAPLGQQGAGVSFFGVFDGHGGAEAAEFAAQAVPALLARQPELQHVPVVRQELLLARVLQGLGSQEAVPKVECVV